MQLSSSTISTTVSKASSSVMSQSSRVLPPMMSIETLYKYASIKRLPCQHSTLVQLLLYIAKEMFDGIQPWWILSIEDYNHFEGTTCFEYYRVFVNSCIVHHNHYIPIPIFIVCKNALQHPINKVLKNNCIYLTLYYLVSNQSLLWDSWDPGQLIVLPVA